MGGSRSFGIVTLSTVAEIGTGQLCGREGCVDESDSDAREVPGTSRKPDRSARLCELTEAWLIVVLTLCGRCAIVALRLDRIVAWLGPQCAVSDSVVNDTGGSWLTAAYFSHITIEIGVGGSQLSPTPYSGVMDAFGSTESPTVMWIAARNSRNSSFPSSELHVSKTSIIKLSTGRRTLGRSVDDIMGIMGPGFWTMIWARNVEGIH